MQRRTRLLAITAFVALSGAILGRELLQHHGLWPEHPIGAGPYLAVPSDPPCEAAPERALTFYALGDTGEDSPERASVVAALGAWSERDHPSFVALLGDNFYPRGVDSADSPRFERDFEGAFPRAQFDVPFQIVLGNHDYEGSVEAQLGYRSPSGRWRLPARHYASHWVAPDGATVDLFVLDTVPLVAGEPAAAPQLEWLRGGLAESRADWRIVLGHHSILSGGVHGSSPALEARLLPVLVAGGVDLYLNGHDHDLQVLALPGGPLAVVSGAGAILRQAGRHEATLFSESAPGFARVCVDRSRLCVSIVTTEGVRFERHVAARVSGGGAPAPIDAPH